jgi:LCP family protein required for cell wall assembly
MKRRRRNNIIIALVVAVVVVFLVSNIASCAFKSFASASMSLNDEAVQAELVAANDDEPYYVLLAGLSDYDTSSEAASFLAVLRVDEQNKQFSLMNIPNNIVATLSQGDQDLIRNAVRYGGEGELVSEVKEQTGIDFAHYLRITEEGLQQLVDNLGGVEVDVQYRVDDPRVGHVVILPGQQNLSGEQAVAFVSATNYTTGRTQRTNNQMDLFFGLINKMTSSEGLSWVSDSDVVSNTIKTDMSYDMLSRLATLYGEGATFYTASMPGSQYTSNDVVYFALSSASWTQVKERFMNGEDPNTTIDTSGVDKSSLSLVVQNGSGTDGFASQAAQVLEQNGYTIQDTGNADSFVYTETLVIYKDQDDEAAAEAIVADLGVGRAVYASVYYNLTTDIQVVVGKDWKPVS